ncbi:MAG: cytochrome c biogenesis protein ResB [Phycisphaerae bacterium]|nr:cytochrome c biogenesis protein ResB [Phycisphaerae bacterium]
MKRFRQILFWLTLVLISALVVLCIIGAFLGADRAKTMFNSTPLCIFWVLFAVLLAVGLFAWGAMWRSPGLVAVHVGLLLILAGGIWGSRGAHEWRGNFLNPEKTKSADGYLLLQPYDRQTKASCRLWRLPADQEPQPAGELPFDVEVRRAWVEYYPPKKNEWRLLGLVYDDRGAPRDAAPLSGGVGQPSRFSAVGDVTVMGYNHALRQVELQLTHGGETMTNRVTVGPADEPATLSLAEAFPSPAEWRDAGRPEIVLLPPRQPVRDYKAELVISDANDGPAEGGVIEVNHPLHARGYHFYLSAYDPPMALVVRAVSDDGLYWVYAGFALLMLGVVLRLWMEPVVRRGGRNG